MNSLKNKVIVVTGGNGLLGKAIISYVGSLGTVAINADINVETNLNEGIVYCDVTSELSVQKCIDEVINYHGRIDGWVNNAYPRTSDWENKFEDISIDSWRLNTDYQLNSIFLCSQLVLKVMASQKAGSIVNMSSIYGVVGPDFSVYDGTKMTMPAAYSAIKGGIINFTRYLASYYGPDGIRINCVSPGGIFDNQDKKFVNQYESKAPLRRMGQPADIAPAVAFLLSDESGYVTGHNLMVDGGWTCI